MSEKTNWAKAERNLQLFQRWCDKLQEFELRATPNCTHLAVYSVTPPKSCQSNRPGRPKFRIEDETLLHFRSLGFSWKDIAWLLLVTVKCWTIWHRVRELGIEKITGFSDIKNEELDDIIHSFRSSQGCLVGYSTVHGQLRDIGIRVQRNHMRKYCVCRSHKYAYTVDHSDF